MFCFQISLPFTFLLVCRVASINLRINLLGVKMCEVACTLHSGCNYISYYPTTLKCSVQRLTVSATVDDVMYNTMLLRPRECFSTHTKCTILDCGSGEKCLAYKHRPSKCVSIDRGSSKKVKIQYSIDKKSLSSNNCRFSGDGYLSSKVSGKCSALIPMAKAPRQTNLQLEVKLKADGPQCQSALKIVHSDHIDPEDDRRYGMLIKYNGSILEVVSPRTCRGNHWVVGQENAVNMSMSFDRLKKFFWVQLISFSDVLAILKVPIPFVKQNRDLYILFLEECLALSVKVSEIDI